jgi:hypothetical protein
LVYFSVLVCCTRKNLATLIAAATTIILSNQCSVETVDTNFYTHVISKQRNSFSLFCLS